MTDDYDPTIPGPLYAFIDTETTSLRDPFMLRGGRAWEVALIVSNLRGVRAEWTLYPDLLGGDLALADPRSLEVNHFGERAPQLGHAFADDTSIKVHSDRAHVSALLATILRPGITLVAANPSFDARHLEWLMRNASDIGPDDQAPWDHHLYDVTVAGAARAGIRPPYSSDAVSKAIGVDRATFEPRHTALADARWVEAQFLAIYPDTP